VCFHKDLDRRDADFGVEIGLIENVGPHDAVSKAFYAKLAISRKAR